VAEKPGSLVIERCLALGQRPDAQRDVERSALGTE
jgi:hypothetical protein